VLNSEEINNLPLIMFNKKAFFSALSMLLLLAVAYYAFELQKPTIKSEQLTANSEFSLNNAQHLLKEFTNQTHYTGSEAKKNVQDYLIGQLTLLGLEVEVQSGVAWAGDAKRSTRAENIIGKLPANNRRPSTRTLVLMSHYDSATHSSYGASDAGSGVVAILEGLRAFIASENEFTNDILVLFTDAEEIGLMGAEVFVNEYEDLDDIALAFNFEARGSGGRSYMFMETPGHNAELLRGFEQAEVQKPIANSLMYSIYKRLPNDTDLTIIKNKGKIPGFNFAFIGDHFDYHTEQDIASRLDPETLMQQGNYLMGILNYFSNTDLNQLQADHDMIYTNFPGLGLISYSYNWNIPLLVTAYIVFLILVFLGLGHGKLSVAGIMKGFVPLFLSIILSVGMSVLAWRMLQNIYPQYKEILHGFTYNGYEYIAAIMSFTITIFFLVYYRALENKRNINLLVAPLFFWMFLNLIMIVFLPGGSFLIIPVFLGLMMLYWALFKKSRTYLIYVLCMAPILFIVLPFTRMFPVGLGLKALGAASFFLILILSLAIGLWNQISGKKWLVFLSFSIGVFFMFKADGKSEYNSERKRPNSLNFVYDDTLKKSFWETYDSSFDSYTAPYFSQGYKKGPYRGKSNNGKYRTGIQFHNEAQDYQIPMPLVNYSLDSLGTYHLKIKTNRKAKRFDLRSDQLDDLRDVVINGRKVDYEVGKNGNRVLLYLLGNPSDSLQMDFKASIKPEFELIESSYDLYDNPFIKVGRRDQNMMPMPFVLNDAIIVRTKVK